MSVGSSSSCSCSISSRVHTMPLGLCGVLIRMARVFGRDGGGDLVEVGAEGAGRERHAHHHAAGQLDIGHVAVVAGLQHDDLVARVHDGQDDGQDGLRGAGGDGDLARGVVAVAVDRLHLGRNGLAQRRHAGHGRVLVQAALHGVGHGIDQARVALEIGEALAQVDRTFFGGQRRHDGEDGGADVGQAALEGRGMDTHIRSRTGCRVTPVCPAGFHSS